MDPLCRVKVIKTRTILDAITAIDTSVAWPLLCHDLCHTSYVQSNITVCVYECIKWMSDVFVLTSDLIASFVRRLTVRLYYRYICCQSQARHQYAIYSSYISDVASL